MFPHIQQQLTDKMVDDLTRDYQETIQAIQYSVRERAAVSTKRCSSDPAIKMSKSDT